MFFPVSPITCFYQIQRERDGGKEQEGQREQERKRERFLYYLPGTSWGKGEHDNGYH